MAAKMTSRVKWVQKIIEKIQGIKAPAWYVDLMGAVQEAVFQAIYQFAAEELKALKEKIIEIAESDLSSEEKFSEVFEWAKLHYPEKKDSVLNTVINAVYLTIKAKI